MKRVSNVVVVNDDRFNDDVLYVFSFLEANSSNENHESSKNEHLNDHFFWILCTWDFHFSLMSICILKIRIMIEDFLMISFMLMIIIMSKYLWLRARWNNSYLINAKRESWRLVHCSHTMCVCSQVLQLFVVLIS